MPLPLALASGTKYSSGKKREQPLPIIREGSIAALRKPKMSSCILQYVAAHDGGVVVSHWCLGRHRGQA